MITTQTTSNVHVHPRYRGLPGLVLGGYSSGLLAGRLDASSARVRLRRPVPLDRDLELIESGDGAQLRDGEMLLAEAVAGELEIDVPPAPTPAEARAAAAGFPGAEHHPYCDCFACGTARAEGDGLRVFPGPLADRPILATTWTPPDIPGTGEPVGLELIWSAFDCAQLWALMTYEPSSTGERAVTAELAGTYERPVQPGETHTLLAWSLGRRGDSLRAGAALVDADGSVRAASIQTAVVAKWGVPLDFTLRSR